MTDTDTLIQALKAAGHDEPARMLRDHKLATDLREAGHATLAETLENGGQPTAPAAPAATATAPAHDVAEAARQAEGDALMDALKRDLPDLVDREGQD